MSKVYDVIVVGGGSAGCTLAARLSEEKSRKVLLLEAGQDPLPIPDVIAKPGQALKLLMETPYLAMYPTERNLDRSIFYSLAGRVMGGGSSVNMMSVPRPTKADFDAWVREGNSDWSFDKVLPILKRIESDQDYPDSPLHGKDGPLYTVAGIDAVRGVVERTKETFSEFKTQIHDVFGSRDRLVVRLSHYGTGGGMWRSRLGDYDVTGKTVTWNAIAIFRFEDQRIIEEWVTRDELAMILQFGLLRV